MKKEIIIILLPAFLLCLSKTYSQTLNWNSINGAQHVISVNFALDYSVSYSMGYSYKLNTKHPLILNSSISIPSGKNLFDDIKVKIGGQILLMNNSHFKGSVSLHGIYRKHETSLVRLQNFGSELKGAFGYYSSKGFVAVEAGFDKAIVTHFKHSKIYREEIYADVIDSWYGPTTGGNFSYGLQTGYSFKKYDVTLNIGNVLTQDFKTKPSIPYYLNLGFNYRRQ